MVALLIVIASVTVVSIVLMVVVLSLAAAHRRQYLDDLAASRFPTSFPVRPVSEKSTVSKDKAHSNAVNARRSKIGRRHSRTVLSIH